VHLVGLLGFVLALAEQPLEQKLELFDYSIDEFKHAWLHYINGIIMIQVI
jgi:hypothetical protein